MYKAVIGLEVHCELKSNSKNFSFSRNSYSQIPNSNVSVIDLGFPGILPVVNREAVKNSIKMALAMHCEVPKYLTFERKNYFYPDLPKGYQITQFKNPIGTNGYVMINVDGYDKKVLIHDTHLEEDTASLDHYSNYSLIDYNRCGVPLLETVTEPCLNSADEAVAFLEELRNIFLYCDTSYARSDRGQIRCDVNVSLMRDGDTKLGTRVEMKNINSFSGVREAIISEIKRQEEILNNGGVVDQETRRFDEVNNCTYTMRSKEDAIDYRYFTDPNLPPIKINREYVDDIRKSIPKLPYERFKTYTEEYLVNVKDANTIIRDKVISDFYEEGVKIASNPLVLSNWLTGDLLGNLNKMGMSLMESGFTPKDLVSLINMIDDGKISGKQGKMVLYKCICDGKKPMEVVNEEGICQIDNDEEIRKIVCEVISENIELVDDYKSGKRVFDYFIGQIMKKSKGRVNPKKTAVILKEELDKR